MFVRTLIIFLSLICTTAKASVVEYGIWFDHGVTLFGIDKVTDTIHNTDIQLSPSDSSDGTKTKVGSISIYYAAYIYNELNPFAIPASAVSFSDRGIRIAGSLGQNYLVFESDVSINWNTVVTYGDFEGYQYPAMVFGDSLTSTVRGGHAASACSIFGNVYELCGPNGDPVNSHFLIFSNNYNSRPLPGVIGITYSSAQSIPEPNSSILLSLGIAILLLIQRRLWAKH